ncbi:GNAT family N-acetyltransferase [uncultured Tateyamaria sp.]|uniref:GNAT family N-acetyltransferase n=1 Tax=uncultured Tateyamaria sp. TaxID=455651 RepID=UPI0026159DEF|nr:GNAT family N-acetyltransferase [uncultured Tateyamaria sp.]
MMQQRGLDRSASRVAQKDGTIAAIWLVSVRGAAAYLISSGTVPEFRSQGLAKLLSEDCIDGLKRVGVRKFQTEVLTENATAASLYHKIGMRQSRELSCYNLKTNGLPAKSQTMPIEETHWSKMAPLAAGPRDWNLSWQNSDASLQGIGANTRCFAIQEKQTLFGYIVVIPEVKQIAQIAVRHGYRRQGIATALLKAAADVTSSDVLRMLNVDSSDASLAAFLEAMKAERTMGQFELILKL